MPTVNFEGDASGAIAAAQAAQGAIDAVHGKTVTVDVQFKQAGGGGAAGLADGFARAGAGAERAGRAARGMAEDMQRAGVRVAGMAAQTSRAAGGMRETADHAERMGRAVAAVAGGNGMREIQAGATAAGRGMRELESGASRAGATTRRAIQSSIIDLQQMEDGSFGVAAGMKAITAAGEKMRASGAGGGPKPFSWAGQSYSYTAAGEQVAAESARRKAERDARTAGRSPVADRLAAARAARAAADGEDEAGKSAQRASGHVMGFGRALGMAQNAGWQLAMVGGMMAGVTTEAGKLMNSTTGMGLNFKGMAAGITEAEQSAARAHNLGLNGLDQSLRQSARSMVGDLVPAMRAGVQATKAFEQAKMGAQASMGPGIEEFANTVARNSPALQQEMGALGRMALSTGSAIVAGLASPQVQQALQQLGGVVAQNAPQLATATAQGLGGGLKALGTVGEVSSGIQGIGESMDKAAGGFPVSKLFDLVNPASFAVGQGIPFLGQVLSGNFGPPGRAGGAPRPSGGFDPSKPFSGPLPDGKGGFTYGPGENAVGAAQAPAPAAFRTPPQYAGMSAPQIYESQYRAATGYASTGVGRPSEYGGFGSGVRPIPAGIGAALAGAGASDTAGALVNHVQKAVHVASGAAQAGGSQLGAQMGGGIAQGIQTTQTVVDTVMVKHLKHVQDIAAGAGGIDAHSPSEKYRKLFRYVPEGMAAGIRDGMYHPTAAMSDVLGQMQADSSLAAAQADLDQARTPVTVSASRALSARQYSDPVMDRIQAHNDRAQQLAQRRADLHEAALARAGVAGHRDPFADPNSAYNNYGPRLQQVTRGQQLVGAAKNMLHDVGNRVSGVAQGIFHGAGLNSAAGLMTGMVASIPKVAAAGGQVASAGHAGYKKKDRQSSPSAAWADMGANSVAGVPIGFSAGVPAAVSAMSDAAGQMSMALAGPLSDYGLKAGDTFAQSLIDGSSREIRAASYGALGEPGNLNPNAMANLVPTGLLRAGSGASALKTPSGGPSVVVLPPAAPQNISITLKPFDVHIGDQVVTVADQRIELALDAATSTYQTL